MSEHDMTPLTPDEALHAFMDGELDNVNEQSLFDELAANPDLRGEMKDALAIRDAVHQDLLSPPAAAESGLLATLGLTAGAGAAATMGAATAATSAGSTPWLSRTLFTVGGGVAGFLMAWGVFGTTEQPIVVNTRSAPMQQTVQTGANVPVRVDTVYAVKVVPVRERAVPQQDVLASTSTTTVAPTELSVADENTELATMATSMTPRSVVEPTSSSSMDIRPASPFSPPVRASEVTFRVRSLASGLDPNEPMPSSVRDAVLPNSAFAFLIPVGKGQRLGLEMGTESWKQTFTGTEDGREVEISQTPLLFWMGATYQITPMEFRFLPGLSPFVDATVGMAFSQGPVGRATVGLAYQPFGPIRLTVGLDGSALMYQYQSQWFTSTKWGMSYGISFDIGSIR
jgi:hypothetical protein